MAVERGAKAGADLPDTKIIVMTDLHLKPSGETIIGIDPWVRFESALTHMLARHPDAARLVLMGDLAHHGKRKVYRALGERLAKLPIPVSLTLGNHDKRGAFLEAFGGVKADKNGFMQSFFDTGNERLILLDTLDEGPHQHWGRLCEKRVAWLAAALDSADGRRVSLYMHHPAFDIGYPGLDAMKLREADTFLDMCEGRVAHIFAGHVHRTISASSRGIGLTTFKSTVHQSPLLLDSWDTSIAVDEPGAYGVVLFTPRAIIAHSEDFDLSIIPDLTSRDTHA